jgi:hypothetical protein
MTALSEACIVVSSAGCYAPLELEQNPEQFAHVDHEGRVSAATDLLVDFVKEWFADDTGRLPFQPWLVRPIAELVARSMIAQFEHDAREVATVSIVGEFTAREVEDKREVVS